jgi:putative ABC transport system permease protein
MPFQDLRYAVRMLLRSPGFSFVVVATLALGIGANTAIFSLVEAMLLRPLPFSRPDRLLMIWERNYKREGSERNVVGPSNFVRWSERSGSFESLAGYAPYDTNLTGSGTPERLRAGAVTANLFSTLGINAAIGRAFLPDESRPGAPDVVLLSEGLWKRRFGANPAIVGQTIVLNSEVRTVVGVLPPTLQLPSAADVWVPLTIDERFRTWSGRWMQVVGRLKDGVSVEQARSELDAIAKRLEEETPDFNAGWGVTVAPLHRDLVTDVRPALLVLMGAVGLVLLIACANVANLLLARAAVRERELAIRASLGASASRLARQLITESIVLAAIGGAIGLLFASWSLDGLLAIAPDAMPSLGPVGLDIKTLFFTAGLSVASALVFGLVPAFHISRPALRESLAEGARTAGASPNRQLLRDGVAVAQVALALVLLVGAGLLVKSFWRLTHVDPGFKDDVLSFQLSLPGAKYREAASQTRFYTRAIERIQSLPNVKSAGAMSWRPFGMGSATSFALPDRATPRPGEEPVADVRMVTPDLFKTLGIAVQQGRVFTDRDTDETAQVVVANKALVDEYWPGQNPIGKRIMMDWDKMLNAEVIGVVGDVRLRSLDAPARATLYWPISQVPNNFMTVLVRATGDAQQLVPSIRRELASIDPEIPMADIMPLSEVVSDSLKQQRFLLVLIVAFGTAALSLAFLGLYGVMSYLVSQRTREFGVRLALGATARDILSLVIRRGAVLTSLGLAIGLAGAFSLAGVLASLLFEVSATDVSAFAAVLALLAIFALVASYLPARRAVRIDPVVALRSE